MTQVLYVRVSHDTKAWLNELAERSGLSLNRTCETLFDHLKSRRLTIESHVVVRDESSP